MLNERELTIEEQILEKMNVILYRFDKIEEKINQLNDPYNSDPFESEEDSIYRLINDNRIRSTIIDSTQTDCKILIIDENGEPING